MREVVIRVLGRPARRTVASGMACWRRLALLIVAACTLPFAAGQAEDKPAALDLSPSTIAGRTISGEEPAFFLVRLKAGSQELTDVSVSAFSNDGLDIAPESPSTAGVASIPANAEQIWKFRITPAKGDAVPPGTLVVSIAAAYKEGKDPVLQRYQFGSLTVSPPGAVSLPTLAELDFKGSLESVSYQRPRQIFVTVTNKYTQALDLTDLKVSTPAFITAKPDLTRLHIPYGEAGVVPVTVSVSDRIVPGKYPFVVAASLRTENGLSATVVKAQDADIAVLGESDLLGKIGAPSMLFLPGVLFLLSWQLLWSIGKDAAQRQAYPLGATTGGFWVISVAISFLVARLYPLVFSLFKDRRDYLVAYGFDDYGYLFALVIASAVVLFVAWEIAKKAKAAYDASVVRSTTPATGDLPVDIVTKLGRLGATAILPRARAANGAGDAVFMLDRWSDAATVWVVPPAILEDGDEADANSRNLLQRIVAGEIVEAKRLAALLRDGIDSRKLALGWTPTAGLNGPRKAAAAQWSETGQPARFIRGP